MPFGGLLGSTFNYVFENQMEKLQNGDRFYYLERTAGLNFLTELENNSFAKLIMANTDATHLPGDVFSTPAFILEVDEAIQFTGLGPDGRDDPTDEDGAALVIRNNPGTEDPDPNYLQYIGEDHVVLGGTAGDDTIIVQHRRRHALWRCRQRPARGRRRRRHDPRRHRRRHHHGLRAATTTCRATTATTPSTAATAST